MFKLQMEKKASKTKYILWSHERGWKVKKYLPKCERSFETKGCTLGWLVKVLLPSLFTLSNVPEGRLLYFLGKSGLFDENNSSVNHSWLKTIDAFDDSSEDRDKS